MQQVEELQPEEIGHIQDGRVVMNSSNFEPTSEEQPEERDEKLLALGMQVVEMFREAFEPEFQERQQQGESELKANVMNKDIETQALSLEKERMMKDMEEQKMKHEKDIEKMGKMHSKELEKALKELGKTHEGELKGKDSEISALVAEIKNKDNELQELLAEVKEAIESEDEDE